MSVWSRYIIPFTVGSGPDASTYSSPQKHSSLRKKNGQDSAEWLSTLNKTKLALVNRYSCCLAIHGDVHKLAYRVFANLDEASMVLKHLIRHQRYRSIYGRSHYSGLHTSVTQLSSDFVGGPAPWQMLFWCSNTSRRPRLQNFSFFLWVHSFFGCEDITSQ